MLAFFVELFSWRRRRAAFQRRNTRLRWRTVERFAFAHARRTPLIILFPRTVGRDMVTTRASAWHGAQPPNTINWCAARHAASTSLLVRFAMRHRPGTAGVAVLHPQAFRSAAALVARCAAAAGRARICRLFLDDSYALLSRQFPSISSIRCHILSTACLQTPLLRLAVAWRDQSLPSRPSRRTSLPQSNGMYSR